jgi:hypothetical protein
MLKYTVVTAPYEVVTIEVMPILSNVMVAVLLAENPVPLIATWSLTCTDVGLTITAGVTVKLGPVKLLEP